MVISAAVYASASPLWLLLAKALTLVLLVIAVVALLRSAHIDHSPALAARREAHRAPYVSPFAKSLPLQPVAPRLSSGAELGRLACVVDAASLSAQAVHAATATAAREINGAEIALNRLLQDIHVVMPQVITPTIVPRRDLSATITSRQAVAA